MRPGERQVAPSIDGIRRDHVARYEFAARHLRDTDAVRVYDIGCGIGYGSKILADAGYAVMAVDNDVEAIEYGVEHYKHGNLDRFCLDLTKSVLDDAAGAAVCFEFLEHVEDPLPILKRLPVPVLIASVPNESVFPWNPGILYHHRHYTAEQFEQLLNDAGFEVCEWHGQKGPESDVEPNIQGRTLIAVAKRSESPKGGTWQQLPKVRPHKSVAIVAMGASNAQYMRAVANCGGNRKKLVDEVWAINAMGGIIDHDLLFHMDDCRVQEARAERKPNGNIAYMVEWLKRHPRFMTSTVYPDYPGAIEFPLEDVINKLNVVYYNGTVAYAVAWAIFNDFTRIMLYGCDYSYADGHKAEKGRACVEFLLGIAAARGIKVEVSAESSLLDACVPDDQRWYGYDARQVNLSKEGGRIKVTFTDKPLPSAEDMEIRYSHEPAKCA